MEDPRRRPAGADCALRGLARAAGVDRDGGLERATFRVGETVYVRRAVCRAGHERAIERFVAPGAPVGDCPACRSPLRAEPFFTYEDAPGRLVVTQLDRPLRELCETRPDWVLVSEGEAAVLFRDAPAWAEEGRTGE